VQRPYLPLRLRSYEEQDAYREGKLKTVAELMSGMDDRIRDWKAKRRTQRKERQAAKKVI
jgi:hypothetical protein